ncbi:hypothetical protein ABW19_dt0202516 [Dactylella cylindrospora]|nr:hypothetical protein ABW19_dt0202516 [Dactylella cylindrospora]
MREEFSSEATYDSAILSDPAASRTPTRTPTLAPRLGEQPPTRRILAVSSSPHIKISSSALNAESRAFTETGDSSKEDDEDSIPQTGRDPNSGRKSKYPESSPSRNDKSKSSDWTFSMYGSGIDEDDTKIPEVM